mmetsp:Transcript_17652/g.35949  ORF Transcript_17652/g.35949 Transcript_17652/m.35949 type:complete len:879 (-) Transcript_17652:271-2907(-)
MSKCHKVGSTSLLQHDRRTAHEIEAIISRRIKVLLEKILIHEADAVFPSLRCPIRKNVMYLEPIRMFLGPFVQSLPAKNISFLATSEDEGHGRLVIGMTKDLGRDLHDGCDARSSGDHIEVCGEAFFVLHEELAVAVIVEFADRTSHVDGIANLEGIEVLRHFASHGETFARGIGLDNEFDASNVVIGRDGSVTTHDHFAVDVGGEEDVLTGREAQDVFGGLEGEVEFKGVAGKDRFVLEGEGLFVLGVEGDFASGLFVNAVGDDVGVSGFDGIDIEVTNVEFVEHLGRFGGVDGDEVFSGIFSGVDENGVCTARVKVQVLSAVVDLVVDDDPYVFFLVVLANFLHGDELASFLDRRSSGDGSSVLGSSLSLLQETTKSSRVGFLRELGHPTSLLLSGLSGMFELEYVIAIGILNEVYLDAEHLVVSHPHQVPGGLGGLTVVGLVPSTAPNLLTSDEVCDLQVEAPPDPAPVHSVVRGTFDLVDLGDFPVLSSIGGDLNARDATSSSGVGVTSNFVCSGNVPGKVDGLVVIWCGHGRVDVEFIEDVFGLVPPSSSKTFLSRDVRRQDPIIVVVVVVLGLVLEDVDVGHPLDHPSSNVTWNDETNGKSMIGLQLFPVRLVCHEDVIRGVHGPCQRHRRPVLDQLPPRLVLKGSWPDLVGQILMSDELDVLSRHVLVGHSRLQQQLPQRNALPHVGGHSSGTPIEPNRLPDHVLFLPSISGTHQRHRQFPRLHRGNLVHAQIQRIGHQSPDTHAVFLPLELGTRPVIPHVMETRRRDELELIQDAQRRLDVEGMTSRQPHQLPIAGNPLVGSTHVAVIGVGLHVPHRLGLGDDVRAGRAAVLVDHGDGDGRGVGPVEFLAGVGIFVDGGGEVLDGGGGFD